MAREVAFRIVFQGTLETRTPLHIGSGREGSISDAMLARDGQGNLCVPGTSLAGPIRAYLERYFRESAQSDSRTDGAKSLLGYQCDDLGMASRLVVDDAPLRGTPTTEVRDSVGIGRTSGVAVDQLRFDREVLPMGVDLPLQLQWDCRDEDQMQQFNEAIGSLIAALTDQQVRFGAGVSRGFGQVRLLTGHRTRCFALRTPDGMLDWLAYLADPSGNSNAIALPQSHIYQPPSLDLEIAFEPVGPLMVKAAIDGDGVDMLPLMTSGGQQADLLPRLLPTIPGTSIRGALRADAERLVRTLLGIDAPDKEVELSAMQPIEFQNALEQLPLICWLFGRAGRQDENAGDGNAAEADAAGGDNAPRQGRAALAIDDCTAAPHRFPPLSSHQWQAIANASVDIAAGNQNSPLRQTLNNSGLQAWTTGFRVAIDRWTGGAAEGMFFKILEPRAVPWLPIRMRLELERLPENCCGPALALLFLILDRFAQGLIPLGYASNRGMGHVRLTHIVMKGRSLPDWLATLHDFEFIPAGDAPSLVGALDDDLRERLTKCWQAHLEMMFAADQQRN